MTFQLFSASVWNSAHNFPLKSNNDFSSKDDSMVHSFWWCNFITDNERNDKECSIQVIEAIADGLCFT